MEGTDSSRNRDCETETAYQREEEGVDKVETFKERSRPHDACCHEPVGHPDECGVGEEKPFLLHPHAARKSLEDAFEYAPYLDAEAVSIAVTPKKKHRSCSCKNKDDYNPPYAEVKACCHRIPYLLHKEASEPLESADHHNHKQEQHDKKFPAAFKYDRTEDLVV